MFYLPKNSSYFCSILLLLFLAGCRTKQPTYALKPLHSRNMYDQLSKKTETGDVTVRCTGCSRSDILSVFGKVGTVLLRKQNGMVITPVQLHIENNSGYTWSLSPYDIRLPLANVEDVKRRFISGATSRGLTSFTLTGGCGVVLASLGAAASIFHPLIGASMIGAGCTLIFTAPIRSHAKTALISAQNVQYTHVIDSISLADDIIIHPRETVDKLIFVEQKGTEEAFTLRLCNADNPDHTLAYNLYYTCQNRK